MCGIFGLVSKKKFDLEKIIGFFSKLKHRGNDFVYIQYSEDQFFKEKELIKAKNFEKLKEKVNGLKAKVLIGMNYFSVFGKPEIYENFVFNGEVFNYEEVKELFQIKNLKNDGILIKKAFEKDLLNKLKAIYAFAYFNEKQKKLFLARDKVGVNPLFFRIEDNFFIFGSENKVVNGYPLNPRYLLEFNLKNFNLKFKKREDLFKKPESLKGLKIKNIKELKQLIEEKLISSIVLQAKQAKKVGVLFSGGVDSTFIAKILQENDVKFRSLIVGAENSLDLEIAQKIAEEFSFDYKIKIFDIEDLRKDLSFLVNNLETSNIMKVSVAIPMYYGSLINDYKVVLSGIGSEELFGGYERHKKNVKEECIKGLLTIWDRDLYRDNIASFLGNSELRVPFLDEEIIYLSLKIPNRLKIKKLTKKEFEKIKEFYKKTNLNFNFNSNTCKKFFFRQIAEKHISIYAFRPKKAAQYGSKSEKLIQKLAKEKGLNKREYLQTLLKEFEKVENVIF